MCICHTNVRRSTLNVRNKQQTTFHNCIRNAVDFGSSQFEIQNGSASNSQSWSQPAVLVVDQLREYLILFMHIRNVASNRRRRFSPSFFFSSEIEFEYEEDEEKSQKWYNNNVTERALSSFFR